MYQAIFVSTPGQAFVGSDLTVTATSSSGLPVDLSVLNEAICTISSSGTGSWTLSMLAGA
jgi:hypothetical protein